METLARHEKALLDLSKKLNLSITQIYKEIVSGETISSRPVVQQLLYEVEQGKWTGVLVMEIERLARGDTIDQGIVARAFKMGNAKIITPLKVYDPNNEFDEEYFEFGLFMSRREYKTINRRIQRGRIASAKEGKAIISTPPYGYDKVRLKDDKGYTLKPNKTEAEAVKLIFDWYNSGIGMQRIANKLDDMKIKPRIRGTWSKATLSDILKNPVYIGKIRWSYYSERRMNIDGEIKTRRLKNKDYIYVDGLHPAIISKEAFNKAQEMRAENTYKRTKNDLSLKNPLSGIVYCKKCGSMMSRLGPNHHTPYDTLRCLNRYCNNVSAPLYLIEKRLLENLQIWLDDYMLQLKDSSVNVELKSHLDIKKEKQNKLLDEIKKVEKQISQTYDLVESEVYTVEVFIQRNQELAKRKDDLQKAIDDIDKEINYESNVYILKENAIPLIERILDNYDEIESAAEKNMLLKSVILRADYIKDKPNPRGKGDNDNFTLYVYPKLPKEKVRHNH